jgi:hypothetical protein
MLLLFEDGDEGTWDFSDRMSSWEEYPGVGKEEVEAEGQEEEEEAGEEKSKRRRSGGWSKPLMVATGPDIII